MAQLASDIRGVLIPVTEAKVLLPNASVSEVITYGTPQPIEGMPEWVFGVITWRGWRIPLYSFSLLAGQAQEENFSGAKVAIIKALTGEGEMPFMALLAQGFPRLTAVTTENLLLYGDQDAQPPGVIHTVSINDEPAFVPDLDAIESRLLEVVGMREPGPDSLLSAAEAGAAAVPVADAVPVETDEASIELEESAEEPEPVEDDAFHLDDDEPGESLDDDPLLSLDDDLNLDDDLGLGDDTGITLEEDDADPLSALDVDDAGEPVEIDLDSLTDDDDEIGGLDDEINLDDEVAALGSDDDEPDADDESLDHLSDNDLDFDFDLDDDQ